MNPKWNKWFFYNTLSLSWFNNDILNNKKDQEPKAQRHGSLGPSAPSGTQHCRVVVRTYINSKLFHVTTEEKDDDAEEAE